MKPIFIPTKKRSENCSLIKLIQETFESNATIVLEKEDFEPYHNLYPKFNYIVLPESEQGIAYVRNYIKQHCEQNNIEWYWMIDDDITDFRERIEKKMVKVSIENALGSAEDIVSKLNNVGQASLEYQQLSWSTETDYKLNSYNDVCVLINTKLTKEIQYRPYVAMKEDRDFTMQIIASGVDVCRVLPFAFSAPKNGSNKGGLKEIAYDIKGREQIAVSRMVETWGERICFPIVKPDGRNDVKIYWKEIRSKQVGLFD